MSEQPSEQPPERQGPPPERPAARRTERWKQRSTALAGTARELPHQVPLVGRALRQLFRVNLLDCATRLAAQAFLSALPALFVISVFTPAAIRDGLVHSLRKELGLQGAAAQSVQQLLGAGHEEDTGFGVIGALVTLLSATALSRAMQRVCERCWELPKSGTRVAAWRWLVWLMVWLVCLVCQTPVREGFGLGAWLGVPLTFLGGRRSGGGPSTCCWAAGCAGCRCCRGRCSAGWRWSGSGWPRGSTCRAR